MKKMNIFFLNQLFTWFFGELPDIELIISFIVHVGHAFSVLVLINEDSGLSYPFMTVSRHFKIVFFIFDSHLNILRKQCVDQMKCICGLETKDTSLGFFVFFCFWVWLIYNIVLVSGIQQNDSVYIYMYLSFFGFFSHIGYYRIFSRFFL